jgi:hypothetical protein
VLPKGTAAGAGFSLLAVPGSQFDYSGLTATLHTTFPIDQTFGPMSFSDLVNSIGSDSLWVNANPFDGGNWTCSGNTLVRRFLTSVLDTTWIWTRTSQDAGSRARK